MKSPELYTESLPLIITLKTGETFPFSYPVRRIESHGENEERAVWMFTEGNFGCDCNLGLFLAEHQRKPDPDLTCGETLAVQRITYATATEINVIYNGEQLEY